MGITEATDRVIMMGKCSRISVVFSLCLIVSIFSVQLCMDLQMVLTIGLIYKEYDTCIIA